MQRSLAGIVTTAIGRSPFRVLLDPWSLWRNWLTALPGRDIGLRTDLLLLSYGIIYLTCMLRIIRFLNKKTAEQPQLDIEAIANALPPTPEDTPDSLTGDFFNFLSLALHYAGISGILGDLEYFREEVSRLRMGLDLLAALLITATQTTRNRGLAGILLRLFLFRIMVTVAVHSIISVLAQMRKRDAMGPDHLFLLFKTEKEITSLPKQFLVSELAPDVLWPQPKLISKDEAIALLSQNQLRIPATLGNICGFLLSPGFGKGVFDPDLAVASELQKTPVARDLPPIGYRLGIWVFSLAVSAWAVRRYARKQAQEILWIIPDPVVLLFNAGSWLISAVVILWAIDKQIWAIHRYIPSRYPESQVQYLIRAAAADFLISLSDRIRELHLESFE